MTVQLLYTPILFYGVCVPDVKLGSIVSEMFAHLLATKSALLPTFCPHGACRFVGGRFFAVLVGAYYGLQQLQTIPHCSGSHFTNFL